MKKIVMMMLALLPLWVSAGDHVMEATKSSQKSDVRSQKSDVSSQMSDVSSQKVEGGKLTLSLVAAQNYAVEKNRSLKNASLAVQEAYAARWQTIASMLPQVDGSYSVQPDVVLLDSNGFKPAELKLAESLVEENKEMIVERWKMFFANKQ